ncbi:MAG: hypothetical protein ACLU37_06985 [Collinsella sp.]
MTTVLRASACRKLEDDVLAQSQTGGEANAFAIEQLARKSAAGIGLRIRMEQQLGITGAEGTSFGAHELLDAFGAASAGSQTPPKTATSASEDSAGTRSTVWASM